MIRTVLGVTALVLALGCASPVPEPAGGGGEPGGGEFGPEAAPAPEPGLPETGGSRGVEPAAELRSIYFDFDRDTLREEAKAQLRRNARVLLDDPQLRIEIQGNCDERGSEEYNLALGMRRSEAAKQYLIDLGVDGSRISTISFGEEKPAVRGHDEAAWARNRRDDFKRR